MKLSYSYGKQNKVHISCDGEYAFTVDAEYWLSSPYYGVESIEDEEELAAFYEAVGSRCAFIGGLRLLSYRDYCEKEMIVKLTQKGHKREYAENAVARLAELGYINDYRYAEALAASLLERKGMSVKSIGFELSRKGISREIADNITESLDFDPILRIIELLKSKYARNLSDEKGIKKTVAALQRLGYGWSDINCALRQLEVETEVESDV